MNIEEIEIDKNEYEYPIEKLNSKGCEEQLKKNINILNKYCSKNIRILFKKSYENLFHKGDEEIDEPSYFYSISGVLNIFIDEYYNIKRKTKRKILNIMYIINFKYNYECLIHFNDITLSEKK